MLLIISRSIFISLSISIIISTSPLLLGFWILLISLSTAWLRGVIFNSWFAIIIFLIYIGGILVIFAYFSALTPNQPLGITPILLSAFLALIVVILLFYTPHSTSPNTFAPANLDIIYSITTLYFPRNTFLLLLLATTLFFILVAVVKIATLSNGPLRPFK